MDVFWEVIWVKARKPGVGSDSDGNPRSTCHACKYWSRRVGDTPNDLLCAVNVPKPTLKELDTVNNRLAYAYHDCLDFEKKE